VAQSWWVSGEQRAGEERKESGQVLVAHTCNPNYSRIVVQSQPRQIGQETISQKNPPQKRAGGVAQGIGPEFKPQYHTHTKR
jgi:hypothetical protein